MSSLLEPEFAEHYHAWKADPSPHNSANLLKVLAPVTSRAIALHVGPSNPLLESRARAMTLEGAARYDPERGRLQNHLLNHLQGLKRVNRKQTTILKVPERLSLDRNGLETSLQAFRDEHGREPSDGELANHSGFSRTRIARIRSYRPAVAEGTLEALNGTGFGGTSPGVPDESAWEQLVYDDLPSHDQRVVDMVRAGVPNQEIARRLRVSPGAVSQRKARIQALYDQGTELSPF